MSNSLKLILEDIKFKRSILSESIKIKKTKPMAGGFWIIITSDLPGKDGNSETAVMSRVLKVSSKDVFPYDFEVPRNFQDRKTGIFGWGYFIGPNTTNEKAAQYLNNLKFLVSEFNKSKSKEEDLETSGLSLAQIQQLEDVIQAVEAASNDTENSEVKNNLEKYLRDLENAVEDDSVFEFLIENFEKAKTFQKRNTGWKYSVLNALIVVIGDPTATYAGPEIYWGSRNYQVKKEFVGKGIIIFKPKTGAGRSDIKDKVDFFKKNPEALGAFKKELGISDTETFSIEDKKNAYQLAKYATEKKLVGGFKGGFEKTMVYSDNMVEVVPGKEPVEITDLDYSATEVGFDENLTPLFDGLLACAEKNQVNILSNLTTNKTDLNNFNKILSAVALKLVTLKVGIPKTNPDMEFNKVQAEAVSHIVKKYFKLSADTSKYNIASWGGDKEKLSRASKVIMNIADLIINQIEYQLNNSKVALSEVRRIIQDILRSGF